MATPLTARRADALLRRLRAQARAKFKPHPQYKGHWDKHILVRVTDLIETKMGIAFVADELALGAPEITLCDGKPYRSVYSVRNGIDTVVWQAQVVPVYDPASSNLVSGGRKKDIPPEITQGEKVIRAAMAKLTPLERYIFADQLRLRPTSFRDLESDTNQSREAIMRAWFSACRKIVTYCRKSGPRQKPI
jgi:hypothetical protein